MVLAKYISNGYFAPPVMEFLLKQTISFQSQNLKARNSCKLNRDEEKRWVLLIIRVIIIKFTCPVGKGPGKLSSNKVIN